MRRGLFIFVLSALLVVGGLSCALSQLGADLFHFQGQHPTQLLGFALVFLGAVAGMVGMVTLRAASAAMRRQLQQITDGGDVKRIDEPHPDMAGLSDAVNAVIQNSEDAVNSAHMQVKELEIQLKVATAERQHAEAIIYSISDAVLVTDRFDELVLANDSAARTFDFDLAQAGRLPLDQILRDPEMIQFIREMRQSNSTAGQRIIEHQIKTPAGEKVFKVTLSCVDDRSSSEPAGVVAVLHDMTREKEVAEMKNDFVSSVSHELRTPLASIKAYVEMLIDGEADDEKTQREFYEVIQNEANRLSRLIDNILNVSRIESGLVKTNRQAVSLTVLVKEAVEVIQPQARQREIVIDEQLQPAIYQTMGDKDMLYQAVLNLLSNAVKYTPEKGKITVQTLVDEAKKKVITRISDTGVGIPPKDLPFVFDKFYRADANSRMAKGTGLGLSLVKQIIEKVHHGRIFVESHVGKGSTFGFELDLLE